MSDSIVIGDLHEVRRKIWKADGQTALEHIGWFRDFEVARTIAEAFDCTVTDYTRRLDAHYHRDGHAIIDGERVGTLREVAYFDDATSFWRASGLAKLRDEERAALGLGGVL